MEHPSTVTRKLSRFAVTALENQSGGALIIKNNRMISAAGGGSLLPMIRANARQIHRVSHGRAGKDTTDGRSSGTGRSRIDRLCNGEQLHIGLPARHRPAAE
jgi:hypothetical protein